MDIITNLFDTSNFPPRWHCGAWTPELGWLHILSDLGVWSAYVAIPLVLGFFAVRKREVPFRTLFLLFGVFILAGSTTHLMEAIIFWWPAYRLAGLIKLFTAVVSWLTVFALVPLVPKALALRSPDDLEREIAERKKIEEALRLTKIRLDAAVRGSNIGIWEIDMPDGNLHNGRVDFTNVLEQLGHDGSEGPVDFSIRMALVHPDDRRRVDRAISAYLSGENGQLEIEHRALHKDGSYRWMLTRGVAVKDGAGRPVRMVGSSVDITDHRRAEQELRTSEERFRRYFELGLIGMAITSPTKQCVEANDEICKILGYTREEMLKKTWEEMTHPDDVAADVAHFTRVLSGESDGYSMDKRWLRKDGQIVHSIISVKCLREADGSVDYFIALLQDITERKWAEEELLRAKEGAEAANRAKDEFLANVSHEIRTPMNAILGMTELALDTLLTDDQRQCLETVKSAGDNLLAIINDLLDFSKIAAGKLELDPTDFSLRTAVSDTLRSLAIRAHKKGLELVYHVESDVPDALIGDTGRLRQVLLNLVGNAIKFTEHGEVVVQVRSEMGPMDPVGPISELSEARLHFEVRDTGIGIPKDKQESIFRAFEQEDTSTTRRYGGTGLGLTIAARLVALMGGTITVDSVPGQGSTFAFTARFGLSSQPMEPATARLPDLLHDLPVLIVDDNATNRYILEEWLRNWQMKPTAVADGLAALDALWKGAASGQPYALILLDACMPETDGLTLAAQIRQREELSATRIILLTSGDRPSDRDRDRELRIEAHLLKPVPQNELLDTIYRVMSRTDGATVSSGVVSVEPSGGARSRGGLANSWRGA